MKLTIVSLILLTAGLIVILLWIRGGKLPPTSRAMKQAARDPAYMAEVSERLRRKGEVKLPADVSDSTIQDWVERLLDEEDREMVFPRERLEQVGIRAEPWLLVALDDERYHTSTKRNAPADTPYEKVVELLANMRSERLVDHLSSKLDSPDENMRKLAALNIAHVGSDAAIPPVQRAIGDIDNYVRSYAIMGIGRAVKSDHATPRFREEMFQALIPLAAGEVERDEGKAVECLVNIDRDRALALLQTDRFLTVRNKELLNVLRALNKHDVRLDASRLWPILAHAKSKSHEYPWKWIYGELLVMLAAHPDDRIVQEIELALDSDIERVRSGAVEALLRTRKLPPPSAFTFALNDEEFLTAPKPQQYLCAIMNLDAEVKNGGFSQYFFNSAGDQWQIALEAAKAVGASRLQSQIERAAAVFGKSGPSVNREKRMAQYGRLSDQTEESR